MGKVYLIGAGPGDADLITVKGMRLLSSCDAVIYDRLATEELLKYVSPTCKRIYVGKKPGQHYKKQEEINDIIVDCAKQYKQVVRLKGGDPFVFGRGGEEVLALQEEGIPFELVPGVTSAISVPELAGLPVTHRGESRSFHVYTGHTKSSDGAPDYDYENIAKSEGTLVFLMGLANIETISAKLMEAGKNPDTPAAVISNGATHRQKTVRGLLKDIHVKVREHQLTSPAIIMIGQNAEYDFFDYSNKKVGVVSTEHLWNKLQHDIEQIGFTPIKLCDMKVEKQSDMEDIPWDRIRDYTWVGFTSSNGVKLFFDQMREHAVDVRNLGKLKFLVIGKGTADKLAEYGIKADFVPSQYNIKTMTAEFAKIVNREDKVLLIRAKQSDPCISQMLDEAGIFYNDLRIYDVVGQLRDDMTVLDALDYIVFVSASGVAAFYENLKEQNLSIPDRVKLVCIGDVTKNRLQQYTDSKSLVAKVNAVNGVIDEISRAVSDAGQ